MDFVNIPIEILLEIFQYFDLETLLSLSQVNKRFHYLINEEICCGRIPIDLNLDCENLKNSEFDHVMIVKSFPVIRKLELINCENVNGEYTSLTSI